KPRVLRVDLERAQRGVLHLRRKRVRHRVAEHAKANWRINFARDLCPIFEIGERVTFDSLHLLRVGNIEDTTLAAPRECTVSGERTRACWRSRLAFANFF